MAQKVAKNNLVNDTWGFINNYRGAAPVNLEGKASEWFAARIIREDPIGTLIHPITDLDTGYLRGLQETQVIEHALKPLISATDRERVLDTVSHVYARIKEALA